jgi:WD repeat-containing protein 42A
MEVLTTNNVQSLLRERQTSLDHWERFESFKQRVYSPPSLVRRLKVEKRLNSHQGCVNSLNFSPDGTLLTSGSDDLHIVLWDWMKGTVVGKFESDHYSNIFQTKFMPRVNNSVIVSAARDGQVRRHVISTTGSLDSSKKVASHNDSAHKLAIEPDNPHVFLSCGEDGLVLEIDLRTDNSHRNKILVCRNKKNGRVPLYSIAIDPSEHSYFAVSGRDQYARIYDRRTLADDGVSIMTSL